MDEHRDGDQFLTLRQASSNGLTNSSSNNCDLRTAARLAARLFGCYRASDANDPETFLAAATATLAHYPEAVAARICDATRGLPAQSKWLPSIAEIREACEKDMAPVYAEARRESERIHTRAVVGESHKAAVGSLGHRRVCEGFARLRESLDLNAVGRDIDLNKLDARNARTPEARALAIKAHEDRLAKLASDFANRPVALSPEALGDYTYTTDKNDF